MLDIFTLTGFIADYPVVLWAHVDVADPPFCFSKTSGIIAINEQAEQPYLVDDEFDSFDSYIFK